MSGAFSMWFLLVEE